MNHQIQIPSYIPISLKSHEYRAGMRTKPLSFRCMSILFILCGRGTIYICGCKYELKPGSLVIANSGDQVQIINDSDTTLVLELLQFYCCALSRQGQTVEMKLSRTSRSEGGQGAPVPVATVSISFMQHLLSKLKQAMGDKQAPSTIKQQLYMCELMLYLEACQEVQMAVATDTLSKTITYMEENFVNTITLHDLSGLAGMTQSSYCRAFKKLVGMTPGQYLTRLRMLKAKELMLDRRSTLREIANQVGYQDELYFSRIFKKTEGMAPSVYLQRQEHKIAIVSRYLLQDHLLALGIQPIAAPAYPRYYNTPSGFPSYLHERLQGTVPLSIDRGGSLRDIVKLSPDLIFKTTEIEAMHGRSWSLVSNALVIDPATRWEAYLREIARRLGKMAKAELIIRQMEMLESKAQTMLSPYTREGTWAVIRLLDSDLRLYGIRHHAFTELFYQRLGFRPPKQVTHSYYEPQALKRLLAINPDHILVLWSEWDELGEIEQHSEWRQLQAVRHGRVYIPDSREWDPWGPIGREYMIHSMINYFQRQFSARAHDTTKVVLS